MRGHIRRRKLHDGPRFEAIASLGYDVKAQRYQQTSRTFLTRTEADAWLREVAGRREGGGAISASRVTVATILDQWLDAVKLGLAPTSYASYEETVRVHLRPAFGAVRADRLGAPLIRRYLDEKLASGLSSTTVRYQATRLTQALRWAIAEGYLIRNPMTQVQLPRVDDREMRVWDVEQARLFLGAAAHHSAHYTLYLVALGTGARQGELLGLRWPDLDLLAGTLRIERTLSRIPHHGIVVRPPKTEASRRTIELAENLVAALLDLKSAAADAGGYVFCQAGGAPLHARNLTNRDLPRLCRLAGVPEIRFHDLRHTAATLMLKGGVPFPVVQRILGHTTARMTLETYGHLVPGMARAAAVQLEAMLLGRDQKL